MTTFHFNCINQNHLPCNHVQPFPEHPNPRRNSFNSLFSWSTCASANFNLQGQSASRNPRQRCCAPKSTVQINANQGNRMSKPLTPEITAWLKQAAVAGVAEPQVLCNLLERVEALEVDTDQTILHLIERVEVLEAEATDVRRLEALEAAKQQPGNHVLAAPALMPVAWGNFREDGTCVGLTERFEDTARWLNPRPLFLSSAARPAPPATPPAPEVGKGRWSEGICGDGAAILFDGVMIPIEEVVQALNRAPAAPPAPPRPAHQTSSSGKRVRPTLRPGSSLPRNAVNQLQSRRGPP